MFLLRFVCKNSEPQLCIMHNSCLIVIFYSGESFLYLESPTETSLSILRTFSCLHDYRYGPLVSVHFQMNYLLFHLQNQRQNLHCQSSNHSKHYSNWPRYFLGFWCGVLNTRQLLKSIQVQFLQVSRRFSDSFKCRARPRKRGTHTRKKNCVQTFVYVRVPVLSSLIA